jgi:hypothetical protein
MNDQDREAVALLDDLKLTAVRRGHGRPADGHQSSSPGLMAALRDRACFAGC